MASMLVIETGQKLRERFPLCFVPDGSPKKPLKVGIRYDLDLRCQDIPADLLRKAIIAYCVDDDYQRALLEPGRARVDLDGRTCGVVNKTQSLAALARLKGHAAVVSLSSVSEAPAEAFAATG